MRRSPPRIAEEKPDIVGATSITPSIYKAERALQIAKETNPNVVTLLGGVHATFMFKQVLSEAPWIDAIVRGEGEEILVEVVRAIEAGAWASRRHAIKGIAFTETAAEGAQDRRDSGRTDHQGPGRHRRGLGHPRVEQV